MGSAATEGAETRAQRMMAMNTLTDYLMHWAQYRPGHVAVEDGTSCVTYAELDVRSRAVAAELLAIRRQEGPQRVVVSGSRKCEDVVGYFGVLRAGATPVLVDAAEGPTRWQQIVDAARADAVVGGVPDGTQVEVTVIRPGQSVYEPSARAVAKPAALDPDSPAYVIYTSGTSAAPKGVVVSMRALLHFLKGCARTLDLSDPVAVLNISSLGFDMSCLDLFLPILLGGRVVIIEADPLRLQLNLAVRLERFPTALIQTTPTTWRRLLSRNPALALGAATLISGGEALDPATAEELARRAGAAWNFYGPTEATVYCCAARIRGTAVDLGSPLPGYVVEVLDADLEPVPVGQVGELAIGGPGLADGYLFDEGLTSERFMARPGSPEPARLYLTGDLGSASDSGRFEYRGRRDLQLQVAGVRVEPEGLERILESDRRVRSAVVLGTTPGTRTDTVDLFIETVPGCDVRGLPPDLVAMLPLGVRVGAVHLCDALPCSVRGKKVRDRAVIAAGRKR